MLSNHDPVLVGHLLQDFEPILIDVLIVPELRQVPPLRNSSHVPYIAGNWQPQKGGQIESHPDA